MLGEILAERMLIALNKVDLLPQETRQKDIETRRTRLSKKFAATKFGENIPIVPVAAAPKREDLSKEEDEGKEPADTPPKDPPEAQIEENSGVEELLRTILENIDTNTVAALNSGGSAKKSEAPPFLFAIDHCFGIKGHGTVLTGTVLQGRVQTGD